MLAKLFQLNRLPVVAFIVAMSWMPAAQASTVKPDRNTKPAVTEQKHSRSPTFLFTISSGSAVIHKLSSNQYTISMKLPDVDQVLMFADRPNRIVRYISGTHLKKLWHVGSNSFAKNPPNAVLSSYNLWPHIVVLQSVKVDRNTLSFNFTSGKPITLTDLKRVVLTLDGLCSGKNLSVCSNMASSGVDGLVDLLVLLLGLL